MKTLGLTKRGDARSAAALTLACLLWAQHAHTQSFRVGIIDFFGLRTVAVADVRAALTVSEGDTLELDERGSQAVLSSSEERLKQLAGVVDAHVNVVCCERGQLIVYVGIRERGAPKQSYHDAPLGNVRLPADVVRAGDELQQALMAAVERGDAGEDRSQGHSLAHDPATRAVQERFVVFAQRDEPLLRRVLRDSSDTGERALAALVLGYVSDKQGVVNDLVRAMSDPSEEVRNSAMRALMVFAEAAGAGHGPRVPARPFIGFLESSVWTDRNKASLALLALSGDRDPAVLAELRKSALPSLSEMAQWKSSGHALPAFLVLARVAGYSDETAMRFWDHGDRETVIKAARVSRR